MTDIKTRLQNINVGDRVRTRDGQTWTIKEINTSYTDHQLSGRHIEDNTFVRSWTRDGLWNTACATLHDICEVLDQDLEINILDVAVCRDGSRFKIVNIDNDTRYPIMAHRHNGLAILWDAKGRYALNKQPHDLDIIKVDIYIPATKKPECPAKELPVITGILAVHDKVVLKSGAMCVITLITEIEPDISDAIIGRFIISPRDDISESRLGGQIQWDKHGRALANTEFDIAKIVRYGIMKTK